MGFEHLFSWIPRLFGWFVGWMPHVSRLHVHEGGVRISGTKVSELCHGFYFWVPHFSQVYVDNVKRKVIDLPEQLLTTKDRERVRAGAVLIYHITNVKTWLVENEDPELGVQTEAERVLREWVKIRTFDDVQDFSPDRRSADELTRLAQDQLGTDFGVRVRQLSLASFGKTDAWDLYHSGRLITAPPEARSPEDGD